MEHTRGTWVIPSMGFNAVIYGRNNAKISKFKGQIATILTKLTCQKSLGDFRTKKSKLHLLMYVVGFFLISKFIGKEKLEFTRFGGMT